MSKFDIESFEQACIKLCNGNENALSFLLLFFRHCQAVDDLVDDEVKYKEQIIEAFHSAMELYNHPFYIQYQLMLMSQMVSVTHLYNLSVKWENSDIEGHKNISDVLRFSTLNMAALVGRLCNGDFKSTANCLEELYSISYSLHHDEKGNPV